MNLDDSIAEISKAVRRHRQLAEQAKAVIAMIAVRAHLGGDADPLLNRKEGQQS